jgi:hypothetical protein
MTVRISLAEAYRLKIIPKPPPQKATPSELEEAFLRDLTLLYDCAIMRTAQVVVHPSRSNHNRFGERSWLM